VQNIFVQINQTTLFCNQQQQKTFSCKKQQRTFLVIQQHTFTVIPTMLQSWKLCILAVVLIINLVQSSAKLSNVNLNQQVNLKLNTLSTPSERSSQSFTSLPKKELNILTIRGGKGGKSKIQKVSSHIMVS